MIGNKWDRDFKPCYISEIRNANGTLDRDFHVGDICYNFKGGLYRIVRFAKHTETGEELVIYESLKDGNVWARPREMFISQVDKQKYPQARQEYRMLKVHIG